MVSKTYFMIATNGYHEFALRLLNSVEWEKIKLSMSKFIVLTDQPEDFSSTFADEVSSGYLKVCEISSLQWPYATLLRYSLMLDHFSLVDTPYVGYIDADMVIVNTANFLAIPKDGEHHRLFLTAHPGYYGVSKVKRVLLTLGRFCIYEKRKTSAAYVKFSQRQSEYVCGGHWFGELSAIRALLTTLAQSVQRDLESGIIALHHDESHLNSYRQGVDYYLLDPRWAYAPGHGKFLSDEPIVEVVDKEPEWFSKRTSIK